MEVFTIMTSIKFQENEVKGILRKQIIMLKTVIIL
jgi:hypothetical protein